MSTIISPFSNAQESSEQPLEQPLERLMEWSELKRWALLGASSVGAHTQPESVLLNTLALSQVSYNALPSPHPPSRPVEIAPEHIGPHPSEIEALESWLTEHKTRTSHTPSHTPSHTWQPYARGFAVCAYLTSLAEAERTLPLRLIAPTLTLLSATFELHKGLSRCPLSPESLWLSIGARGRWLLRELSSLRNAEAELMSCLALTEVISSPPRIEGEALNKAQSALEERLKSLPQKDKNTQEQEARASLKRSFGSLWLSARPHELSEQISPRLSALTPLFEQEELRDLNALWKNNALLTLIREAMH